MSEEKFSLKRYSAVNLEDDRYNSLSANQKLALDKLVQAARILDNLFLLQVHPLNPSDFRNQAISLNLLRLFQINKGPWDRLHDEAFIPGIPEKPHGANFYPLDLTKNEFEDWLQTLSPEQRELACGFYHVIRRDSAGKLVSVPYSEEYKSFLAPASQLLKEASSLVENPSLANFLSLRADSFLSNEYRSSEEAWLAVDEDCPLEITIGPYEVYEDKLLNYKASFEAFITLRDQTSTELLGVFRTVMQDLENKLPIPEEMKNKEIETPRIVVVNEIFVGGDNAGPQTAAFNLPNDEKVKGSKMVILKNVQEAKFDHVLKAIAKVVVRPDQLQHVSFYTFFTHILLHEMSHSLGPHNLASGSTVRKELQECHSAIEEAKADIVGLLGLQLLMDAGTLDASLAQSFYVTYMASAFRSVRFGLEEAHGKGQAVQLNYLLDQGGIEYDPASETFGVNFDKIAPGVRELASIILVIQGKGDKLAAQKLLQELGVCRDHTKRALAKLTDIPVDIAPDFPLFPSRQ